jgi:homoserine kinase
MALDVRAELGTLDSDTPVPDRAHEADDHHPASVAFEAAGGRGRLWVRSPIPIGRGLGFSGAMRVGGAAAAIVQRHGNDALVGRRREVLAVAAQLEGHADNAAASLYGGVVATDGEVAVRIETALAADVVLWIPDQTTSTSTSRSMLPASVPFGDAVFNVCRSSLLIAALAAGDVAALASGTQDRLHQDVRFADAPASREALDRGLAAGAWCGWLSGSGPTVAFLVAAGTASAVVAALPGGGQGRVVGVDRQGTVVLD